MLKGVILVLLVAAICLGIIIKFKEVIAELHQEKLNLIKDKNRLQHEKEEYEKALNETLEKSQKDLDLINSNLQHLKVEEDSLDSSINTKRAVIEQLKNHQEDIEQTSARAFENYCDTLEIAYAEKEQKFQDDFLILQNNHQKMLEELKKEKEEEVAKVEELKKMRQAIIEANLREKKVAADRDYYCLIPPAAELDDIKLLERVKNDLKKPRILSMLIWQTYYQPIAKKKFPTIIGKSTTSGIYKITNIKTEEVYIGQAVDVYRRWNDHAKCGLGIDTPPGNKLYKSMQEDGLYNFSFEVLEEIPSTDKEKLNKQEKYYIEMYSANEFGFNGTKGNK